MEDEIKEISRLGISPEDISEILGCSESLVVRVLEKENSEIPVTRKKTDVRFVDLGLPSGTLWADRNIGATAPEETGDYFRWGETEPFRNNQGNPYKNPPKGIKEIAGTRYDAATAILGEGCRMPTEERFKELIQCCRWQWTQRKGVKGMKVRGPNGNHIFLPAAGYRYYSSGSLDDVGSGGYYWSATATSGTYVRYLYFYSDGVYWFINGRSYGSSVRAVKEK